MQLSNKYSWTKHIDFVIIDTIVLILAFWFSYTTKFGNPFFWLVSEWKRYLGFVVVLNVALTFLVRPYSGILRRPYYLEVVRAFQLTVANAFITTFVLYAFKMGALYSRETSLYMYGLYFVFSALFNTVWKKLLVSRTIVVRTTSRVPLFVIGESRTIEETIHNVTAGDLMPYVISGIHLIDRDSARFDSGPISECLILGQDYCRYILDSNIQEVLVAVAPSLVEEGILEKLHANAVNINIVVEDAVGFQPEDQYFFDIGVYKTLGLGSFSFKSDQLIYLAFKRLMDILWGLIGLVFLIPVALLVKIAYLISGDRGGIFYRQKRVGQNGKTIHIWKFRSMVTNASEVLQELLKDEKYRKEWDENQKFENDPRITKVGNFLRKTSIDELPQLINVFMGEMSLVGPRPLVEGELEKFGGLKLYQRVKPGITGWWACNGRSNIEYRERLELEYYYVKHCSIYLDVICILRTVLAVIKKDGAR